MVHTVVHTGRHTHHGTPTVVHTQGGIYLPWYTHREAYTRVLEAPESLLTILTRVLEAPESLLTLITRVLEAPESLLTLIPGYGRLPRAS